MHACADFKELEENEVWNTAPPHLPSLPASTLALETLSTRTGVLGARGRVRHRASDGGRQARQAGRGDETRPAHSALSPRRAPSLGALLSLCAPCAAQAAEEEELIDITTMERTELEHVPDGETTRDTCHITH